MATRDEAALGVSSESWGRGSRFGVLRVDHERVYWFATANTPAGTRLTAAERKSFLRQRFGGWHHPVSLLLDSTPAAEILQNAIYDLQPMNRWGEGRIVPLGDAAHPTTPNLGQGACMAIESRLVLAGCLSKDGDVAAALRRHETERIPRTAWITTQSWKIGRIGQWENRVACSMRDFLVRIAPPALTRKTLERAAGYQLPKG